MLTVDYGGGGGGLNQNLHFLPIFSRSMTRAEGTKESRTRVSERGFFLNIVACDRRVCVRACVRVSPRALLPTFLTCLRKVILRHILNKIIVVARR